MSLDDAQRCSKKIKLFTQTVLQISFIGEVKTAFPPAVNSTNVAAAR